MNWHVRYTQQAKWTRSLRGYIFNKINLIGSRRVLEVGCGTGAILSELPAHPPVHGLDIDPVALAQCHSHVPTASLIHGNARQLPYIDRSFGVVYCHFLLLWVRDPLQALFEMKRVTEEGGHIIAFAEPDYTARMDKPGELLQLGKWQTEALKRQGANPGFGAQVADAFYQAGIRIIETGTIRNAGHEASEEDWEIEWEVIESDLAGSVPEADIQKMKDLDLIARERKERVLNVPTYFAWGTNETH